ncbi:MAG TPA: ABC transporter ATP-binding protein [Polyangiaceae bacterium]|nr:ABC transporter ATP-binding protein [Polyangiaceae bacterium]
MSALLDVQGIGKSFRGLRALHQVSFRLGAGEILAVIGPNGAGKTTLFNLVCGVHAADAGQILLRDRRIDGLRPDQVCARGIGRTFQIVRPFAGLSVLENVMVGALRGERSLVIARERALAILKRLSLADKRDQPALTLTLPERKRLELARALATRPELLLLDEVMAGLRPTECDQLVRVLAELQREAGFAVLLIEHVLRAVRALAPHVLVLHHGELIADGPAQQVLREPAVIASYLGASALGAEPPP